MATTYTWTVTMLECVPNANGLENIVQTIRWKLIGDDGVNSVEIYNAIGITPPDPNQFVQYSNLTEEQVITWLTDTLGEHGVAEAKAAVDIRLDILANPPVITPELPWNTPPAE
jgi:hypothetical protein